MMNRLALQACTAARCTAFVVLLAAMRCAFGWRGGSTRLRSIPTSAAARPHPPLRELGAAASSRQSYLRLRTASGRSSHISRRRRCRLRGAPRIHDWSLSLPNSPPNSPTLTLNSNREVETTRSIGAMDGDSSSASRAGNLLVLPLGGGGEGGGEGQHQHPPRRSSRRQRRRQRVRLRAFGEADVDVEIAEVMMSGVESSIVGAGGLDIEGGEAGGSSSIDVGGAAVAAAAAVAGGVASEVPGSGPGAASGELGSTLGSPSVCSGVGGGWRLTEEVVRGSPPAEVPRAAAQEARRPGCAMSSREHDRSSAAGGIEALRTEDDRFMRMALRLAERARMEGEVPIGAVLTETLASGSSGKRRVLSTGRNHVERRRDASAHAEMLCLQAAAKARRNWRLAGTTLYVTMEPCAMCLSAAQLFRVDRVIYGAPNPNLGACGGWVDLSAQKHAFHDLEVTGGVLAEECARPLRGFFRSRRRGGEAAASASASASASAGHHRAEGSGVATVGGGAPKAAR